MDSRRLPRTVVDPKVRRVGFFTSGPARSQSVPVDTGASTNVDGGIISSPTTLDLSVGGIAFSPVMTPPPRYASADGFSALGRAVGNAAPVSVHSPLSHLRRDVIQIPVGSFNPSEYMQGTSEMLSPSSRRFEDLEFSEEVAAAAWHGRKGSGKETASFLGSSEEMMIAVRSGGNTALTTASVVKTLPGVTGKGGKAAAASNSGAPTNAKQDKGARLPSQKKDGSQDTAIASEKRSDRNHDRDRKKDVPQPNLQFDDKYRVDKARKRAVVNQFEARNRVELFRHLPQYEHGSQLPYLESRFFQLDHIHPSVYEVGMRYLSGSTSGGNARCKEMLLAFRNAIMDYSMPPEKNVVRDLISKINSYVSFLIECRPLSVNMGNAIRFLKNRVLKLHHNLSELEAKSILISDIDRFINEKIIVADKVIINHAVTKIRDGDVLLVYGHSTVVEMIVLHALELGKQFRIVVVDSRPKFEGQTLLRKLVMKGIICTYTHINAISYIMHEVTRVFLGASSVLSNGTVYARVGTACVAMVAHAFQVPVLICCEAYKFHERILLDSICSNELGDPDVIIKVHRGNDLNPLEKCADYKNLRLLNLFYDATPSDYISMIVTEHGMIPPTSVPVIVREYERDQLIF